MKPMVKNWLWLLLILMGLLGCVDRSERPSIAISTVSSVDIERYQGLWFEIAKIPNRFQAHCTSDTTAEYRLMAAGMLWVQNRCMDAQGEHDEATGVARVVEPHSQAKLEVSFVKLLGMQLFWGNYWILALDADYQYALIGDPNRRYGWVLARTPQLNESQWREIEQTMSSNGYERERFQLSPQRSNTK